jgi:hypothetical protein
VEVSSGGREGSSTCDVEFKTVRKERNGVFFKGGTQLDYSSNEQKGYMLKEGVG